MKLKPRQWLKGGMFRSAAVLLSLAPLLLAEIVLRCGGWGIPSEVMDPYVGFSDIHPLFERHADRYEIAEPRLAFFCPDSFAAKKAPDEYRIFCLGGSTVQGRPYAIETSFTTWLELSLQSADPRRHWEVVNCGGVSYASYRLTHILSEVLSHEPDLIVLCTGHNEFLEDRSYERVKRTPAVAARLHGWASFSRLYNVLRSGWLHVRGKDLPRATAAGDFLAEEVEAVLDYRGGLQWYHRDDVWREDVGAHFRFSLERMVRMSQEAGVPLVLINPPSNLKDCPPFKMEPNEKLSVEARMEFDTLWEEAKAIPATKKEYRLQCVQKVLALDDRHAGPQFLKGHCLIALRQFDEARAAFLRAKDEDICPLRMTEPLRETVFQIASRYRLPLVDACRLFEERTPDGILGDEWLLDHVHPRMSGHQLIAESLVTTMVDLGILDPQSGWRDIRDRSYEAHLASLDPSYFVRGTERLEGLRKWTQGRVLQERSSEP